MAASLHRLVTRPERLRRDEAAAVNDWLDGKLSADDPRLRSEAVRSAMVRVRNYAASQAASEGDWEFSMLHVRRNDFVVAELAEKSVRPVKAIRLWSLCLLHADEWTNEVSLSRRELAERIGVAERDVSTLVSELVEMKALSRGREGGRARYFVNPLCATHLKGGLRDAEQAVAPELVSLGARRAERRRHHEPVLRAVL